MKIDLLIRQDDRLFYPPVEEGIQLSLERQGTPGKLTFTLVEDGVLRLAEGDIVQLSVDGTAVFYGYVFTHKRGKDRRISVTAYDQLRYLKNKAVFQYENKTAAQVLQMLAADFQLETGEVEDTGYVIPYRLEDNVTLFDMIQNALDETLTATGKLYVLYDQVGRLTLRNVESMKLDLLLDGDTLEEFDYQSSIDDGTYNQISLEYSDSQTGTRRRFTAKDEQNIAAWGVLQYTQQVQTLAGGDAQAQALLRLYNAKTRTLTASGVLGRRDVRGGSSILVRLDLGDISLSQYMVVESVRHTFQEQQHLMQLTLRGGGLIA